MTLATHQRPLTPEADGLGVTYAEILSWAVWLAIFTPTELAQAMAVDPEVAARGVTAMIFHGAVEDTGDVVDGPDGPESLFSYRTFAFPADPRTHPSKAPEWQTCEQEILCQRGLPIRLVDNDRHRQSMPGERHRMKLRQKRYERMVEEREKAYQRHANRAQKAPKWKRRSGKRTVVVQ